MKNQFIISPLFLDEPVTGLESLAEPGWLLNNPSLPDGDRQFRMSIIHNGISDFVTRSIKNNKKPISIAGDCCTAIGVLAGIQQAGIQPHLIWLDAHGDFNTWETTPSGFLGGMPLAMMVGKGEQAMPRAVGLKTLPEEKVILADGRDLDPEEKQMILESKITHLENLEQLLSHPLPDDPVYVHFDADVLSLKEAPAQNYPAEGGPSSVVMKKVFSRLARSGRVAAVSITAWNPELDRDKKSENIIMSLLKTFE